MKRILGRSLAAMLVASLLLTSCGGKGKDTESTPVNISAESSKATPKGEFPIAKEKTTLTITTKTNSNVTSFEQGKNAYTDWLAEQTGVDIKFNLYPEADATNKLNLELSSNGDMGDMILGMEFDVAMLSRYGEEGVLEPLQAYVETYGDNITAALDSTDGARELATTPDGNMFAMPYIGNVYNMLMPQRMWINKDFLETLGMAMPTTIDEFYAYLNAVKTTDLNGNGQNDEIPLAGATNENVWSANPLHFLMNSFTVKDQNDYYVEDDTVHAAFAEDGWRSGLQWLNKIYGEGLMDSSVFTNDGTQLKALVALEGGNTVGAVLAGGPHIIAQASDEAIRARYIPVDPLKGPDGIQQTPYQVFGQVSKFLAAIPANSENKEVAFRLLDFMYSEESWMRQRYGEPDVDWEKPAEGTVAANGGQAQVRELNPIWGTPQDKHWQSTFSKAFIFSDSKEALPEGQFDSEKVLFDAAKSYSKYANICEVPNMYFEEDLISDINDWKQSLKEFKVTASAEFITGTRDPNNDKDWESYKKELEENGLTDYLTATQEAFDKTWKGNYPYDTSTDPVIAE